VEGEAGVAGVAVRALEATRSVQSGGTGPRSVGEDDHGAHAALSRAIDEFLDDLSTNASSSVLGSNRDSKDATSAVLLGLQHSCAHDLTTDLGHDDFGAALDVVRRDVVEIGVGARVERVSPTLAQTALHQRPHGRLVIVREVTQHWPYPNRVVPTPSTLQAET